MSSPELFPRELTSSEREILLWLLPADRPGYAAYRGYVERWPVAAAGRRGEGNYILAEPGWTVDIETPLPHLFAYGVVEYRQAKLSISIRELLGRQLEFEMEEPVVGVSPEIRRWTFSGWRPGRHCPSCLSGVREIRMSTTTGQELDLVLCDRDRRIWVFDGRSGVNVLIPVTGFYTELMIQTGVKDPKIAPEPRLLFERADEQSDSNLIRAFSSYNRLRNRITLSGDLIVADERRGNWVQRFVGVLAGEKNKGGEKKES